MLVPLVVFWGAVVLAVYFAVVWDREEAKMRSDKKKQSANMMSLMVKSVWILNRIKNSSINQVAPLIGLSEVETAEVMYVCEGHFLAALFLTSSS